MSNEEKKKEEPPPKKGISPGIIFGSLVALGLGLAVLAFGVDAIGQAIERNMKVLLVLLIAGGAASTWAGSRDK